MRPTPQAPVRDDQSFIEAARRRQIIDCAIETIAALGYERASLSEIAKCAGMSKGNLAYYFPTKDDLIDDVVTDVYGRAASYMLPQIEAQTSATTMLRTLITTNVEFIRDEQTAVQAVIEIVSSSRTAEGRPRFDARGQDQPIADLDRVLRWGQETGEFRPFSTAAYAFAIRTSIDALGPRLQIYPSLDIDEYGRELADLFEKATSNEASPGGAT
jgi:AcrR family transcriptional regulator